MKTVRDEVKTAAKEDEYLGEYGTASLIIGALGVVAPIVALIIKKCCCSKGNTKQSSGDCCSPKVTTELTNVVVESPDNRGSARHHPNGRHNHVRQPRGKCRDKICCNDKEDTRSSSYVPETSESGTGTREES